MARHGSGLPHGTASAGGGGPKSQTQPLPPHAPQKDGKLVTPLLLSFFLSFLLSFFSFSLQLILSSCTNCGMSWEMLSAQPALCSRTFRVSASAFVNKRNCCVPCFPSRMEQRSIVLSDYKKQQNVLEILLCSARTPPSEKLSSSLSVSMWRADQVGENIKRVFPSYDLIIFNNKYIKTR